MARPDKDPQWADGGSADVVEPTSGKKSTGWLGGEFPPAQWLNWLFYYIYLWITYLSRDRIMIVDVRDGHVGTSAGWASTGDTVGGIASSTNPSTWIVPIPLHEGMEITSVRFRVKPDGASDQVRCRLVSTIDSSGSGVADVTSTTGTAWEWLDSGVTEFTAQAGQTLHAIISKEEGSASVAALCIEVTYDP